MNGELAELIWLAAHGTHYLRTGELAAVEPTVFQFVGDLQFEGPGPSATSPAQWFQQLRDRGASRIELDALGQVHARRTNGPLPEQIPVGFANSLRSALVVPETSEYWTVSWTYDPESVGKDKPWLVRYTGVRDSICLGLEHPDVWSGRETLETAVGEAHSFAVSQNLEPWGSIFDQSLRQLVDDNPEIHYHTDLIPVSTSIERRQLTSAAARAWVFGGMGSWNDLVFDGDARQVYESVTRALLQSVMYAFDAAING